MTKYHTSPSDASNKLNPSLHGETYSNILRYFIPEFITALLLYSLPFWLDAYFISHLKSTPIYATLGASNNLMHFIIKVAESFSVGTVIISGQLNGRREYEKAGQAARDSFVLTTILGASIASFLYWGAPHIYAWYGVSPEMIELGVPFLRIRAVGVLFMFMFFSCVGFLRGIKNTRVPMQIFIFGSILFVLFDYLLVFGLLGFPELGLQGSAMASMIQYASMLVIALSCLTFDPQYRKYFGKMLQGIFSFSYAKQALKTSWPIIIDKATLAGAYIWLCRMICPQGACGIATFCVIKDMERFAFLPAIAFAQVITFLVSNDHGARQWESIKQNIKRVVILSAAMVCTLLAFFSLWSESVVQLFDRQGEFTAFAAYVFSPLSVLVFFDLIQLILSGALRGTGDVKVVMFVRLFACLGYFVPVSYLIANSAMEDQVLKFLFVYSSFYLGNALMSLAYIYRLLSGKWKDSFLQR